MSSNHFKGSVVSHPFAGSSKSARVGVFLRTDDGRELMLRRLGGSAYMDPELAALVGKRIEGVGEISGYTLLLEDWKALPAARRKSRT